MKALLYIAELPAPPLLIVLCVIIFVGTAYASYKGGAEEPSPPGDGHEKKPHDSGPGNDEHPHH